MSGNVTLRGCSCVFKCWRRSLWHRAPARHRRTLNHLAHAPIAASELSHVPRARSSGNVRFLFEKGLLSNEPIDAGNDDCCSTDQLLNGNLPSARPAAVNAPHPGGLIKD